MVLVSPSTLVNKANAVTDAAVHVTLYAAQQSLMTVLPGSIHAAVTAIKVSRKALIPNFGSEKNIKYIRK
jgi:hypothetical protein